MHIRTADGVARSAALQVVVSNLRTHPRRAGEGRAPRSLTHSTVNLLLTISPGVIMCPTIQPEDVSTESTPRIRREFRTGDSSTRPPEVNFAFILIFFVFTISFDDISRGSRDITISKIIMRLPTRPRRPKLLEKFFE